ncbi:Beta-1,4 N-acetylgalactosaminyltransferase 1 [Branchiostoma belcheri]|nr:Beta-1,4 N-acetylgalactosaminyltransferase 1 [Branchiostoma belcheri]
MDEIQLVLITLNPDGTDTKLGHMVLVLYKSTKRIGVEIWNTARNEKTSRPDLSLELSRRHQREQRLHDLFTSLVSSLPGMERLSLGIQDLFAAGVSRAPRACPMAEKRMLLLLFLTAYICGIVTLGTISKRMGCNCSDKGATISNFKYFEINELKEVEQRRKAELRKFKIRTETTKETLMIVNGSVPLSYPVQGVVVAPEEWENILGLRVDDYTVHEHYKSKHTCVFERIKVASVCAYQVKLSSSKFGVLDARATVPGVNVDGLGTTLLNMSSRSLDHLNRQLEFVVYVNTVFDIDARDYVHFVYLKHEVVFPIVVRVRKAPILYDLEPGDINNKVTIITKTFLRYSSVRLLLQSIQKYYPKMRVVVADDSRPIEDLQSEYVDHYVMPFASGWFGGRNLAVSQVTTPYLLWVDDDFVFTEETKLEVMVDILDNSNLDLPAIAEPTKHYHLTLGMYEPYH